MFDFEEKMQKREPLWQSEQVASAHNPEFSTIAHKVLREDRRAENFPDTIDARLDSVIQAAVEMRIANDAATVDEARVSLSRIEHLLTSMNFVCALPSLVHSVSDGLFERALNREVLGSRHNSRRDAHMRENLDADFSHVDCDIGTLVYLAIGEVLGLPLRAVEVPGHTFLRWHFSESEYLNWDTNYGFDKYNDAAYQSRYRVNQREIDRGTFLTSRSSEETLGYFRFIRAISFTRNDQISKAIEEYRAALAMCPNLSLPYNNLAWQFVVEPEARSIVSGEEALCAAEKACDIWYRDNNFGTRACVCAQTGDFAQAVAHAETAYSISGRSIHQRMIDGFKEGKTWLKSKVVSAAPVADAGGDLTNVVPGSEVQLNGLGSSDADGDAITYPGRKCQAPQSLWWEPIPPRQASQPLPKAAECPLSCN